MDSVVLHFSGSYFLSQLEWPSCHMLLRWFSWRVFWSMWILTDNSYRHVTRAPFCCNPDIRRSSTTLRSFQTEPKWLPFCWRMLPRGTGWLHSLHKINCIMPTIYFAMKTLFYINKSAFNIQCSTIRLQFARSGPSTSEFYYIIGTAVRNLKWIHFL